MHHWLKIALILTLATPAVAQEFPLTITHKYGETVIPAAPIRVASIDYNGADNLLALGVQPVLIRDWWEVYPRVVFPWADPLMTDLPAVLRGEINFEQIAELDPDLITAVYSGITAADYEKLSAIAPVVPIPEGVGDYSLPWDQQALIIGQVVGQEAEAQAQVDAIRARLAEIAARHPDWQGKTFAVATYWGGEIGVYLSADPRPQLIAALGLVSAPEIDALAGTEGFWATVSPETPEVLDQDVLIWLADEGAAPLLAAPIRQALEAGPEGREVFADLQLSAAFSFASLLSLNAALDQLEPMIAAAIDGDPATAVPGP